MNLLILTCSNPFATLVTVAVLPSGDQLFSFTEAKHGGNKNGKKAGVSRSSFFTWFMVIALLGVWTSVAVVWFELVDYEEVLGKNFKYNILNQI